MRLWICDWNMLMKTEKHYIFRVLVFPCVCLCLIVLWACFGHIMHIVFKPNKNSVGIWSGYDSDWNPYLSFSSLLEFLFNGFFGNLIEGPHPMALGFLIASPCSMDLHTSDGGPLYDMSLVFHQSLCLKFGFLARGLLFCGHKFPTRWFQFDSPWVPSQGPWSMNLFNGGLGRLGGMLWEPFYY